MFKTIENYKGNMRFNKPYEEISKLLQKIADIGYNEHFYWGRLDWGMAQNALFRKENGEPVGVVMYDTSFDDRRYILHSTSDENLLEQMIGYVMKTDINTVVIKANLSDIMLYKLLENAGFKIRHSQSVLEIDLSHNLSFQFQEGFHLNDPDSKIDAWQWRLVIYHSFDNEEIPQEPGRGDGKVCAIKGKEYAAHCGFWYNGGNTAYIEPVATFPEYRRKGLGRAVVYETVNCAREFHFFCRLLARFRKEKSLMKLYQVRKEDVEFSSYGERPNIESLFL